MAATLSSKSPSLRAASCNGPHALLVFLLFLLLLGCASARPAPATMAAAAAATAHKILPEADSARRSRNFLPEYNMGFRYGGQVFSFLPKGVPIPPSGPSNRHNSLVNSAPRN